MPTAADSSEEEDLPSLNELLLRKRALTSPREGAGQQEQLPGALATSQKATVARPTIGESRTEGGDHSTPPRSSPRTQASTAELDSATASSLALVEPALSTAPTTDAHRSLAEELFPPSPPAPLNSRSNLYDYREPSPSIISDSEPDLPSPVKRSSVMSSASEEDSRRRVQRKASVESFWVEDSEDERIRDERSSASATSSAQEDAAPKQEVKSGRGRTSLNVYDLDSDDEQPFITRASSAVDMSEEDDLDGAPGFMTSRASPFLSSIGDTPRASKSKAAPASTTAAARRRITISILDSDSDSDLDAPVRPRPAPKRTGSKLPSASDAEVLIVDDEDEVDEAERRKVPEKHEVVISLPSERSMGGTPIRSRSEAPEEQFDDMDPDDGVLVYEPTPRSRKPKKLLSSPGKSPAPSPSRTPGRLHEPTLPSKRSVSIDLTGSSDDSSEDDLEPPKRPTAATTLFPPPRGPPKPRTSPAPTPSSTPKRSSKSTPARTPSRRSPATLSDAQRESLPLALIRELDRAVFRKTWEGMWCKDREGQSTGPGLPDGIEVKWNNKLRNTAGRASWKRIKSGGVTTHVCTIDLATKVTDTEEKLRHTLAHELCHIAAWVLSGEIKPPHGDAFKLWAKRTMSVRSDITITTTHSYEIVYKYRWQCLNSSCGKIFSRHSRSIDTSSQGCPCGSLLAEIDANGTRKVVRRVPAKKSDWQEYLAVNSPVIRQENPGIRNEDVFKLVAQRYRMSKDAAAAPQPGAEGEGGHSSAMGSLGV